jgi:AraC-like DNA-binding protein
MPRPPGFDPHDLHSWTRLARRSDFRPLRMARAAGFSLVHLRRLCLEYWGEPLVSRLQGPRVVAAQQLLREGLKVKQVAGLLGYRQTTHFSRQFRRLMAVTPKRYQLDYRRRAAGAFPVRSRANYFSRNR